MHVEIKGVHLDVDEKTKEHINKKLHKLEFLKDDIVDLLFTITKEKHDTKVEVSINFKWGHYAHIHAESYNSIEEAVDVLFDKITVKVTREKEKIKHH